MATDLITVLPTAGRAELLARTLRSLAECELPEVYRETIVIENGPKCGAEEVVRQCPASLRARYMYQSEGNKSRELRFYSGMMAGRRFARRIHQGEKEYQS